MSRRTTPRKLFPEIFDRARRVQPGAVQRVDAWWPDQFFWPDPDDKGTRFYCVYDRPTATSTATRAYRFEARWGNGPRGRAHHGSCHGDAGGERRCCGATLLDVDLVETIKAWVVPVDEPLRWLLREPRSDEVTRLGEGFWVRVLDAPAALSARTYATPARWCSTSSTRSGPTQELPAASRSNGGPDGAELGARATSPTWCSASPSWAGSCSAACASALARAGLIDERTPGALAVTDAMFAVEPLPFR